MSGRAWIHDRLKMMPFRSRFGVEEILEGVGCMRNHFHPLKGAQPGASLSPTLVFHPKTSVSAARLFLVNGQNPRFMENQSPGMLWVVTNWILFNETLFRQNNLPLIIQRTCLMSNLKKKNKDWEIPQTLGVVRGALEFSDWGCKYNQRQSGDTPILKNTGQLRRERAVSEEETERKAENSYISSKRGLQLPFLF